MPGKADPEASASPRGDATLAAILSGAAIIVVIILHLAVAGESARLNVLRAVLALTAAGEAAGGISGVFSPRSFAESNGRPYAAAFHGVSQDFGFYNLGYAALFILAAVDPPRRIDLIAVAIALYTVHGATHVFRFFGIYFAGGKAISTRPQTLELRDGFQLLAAAAAMTLFFPAA